MLARIARPIQRTIAQQVSDRHTRERRAHSGVAGGPPCPCTSPASQRVESSPAQARPRAMMGGARRTCHGRSSAAVPVRRTSAGARGPPSTRTPLAYPHSPLSLCLWSCLLVSGGVCRPSLSAPSPLSQEKWASTSTSSRRETERLSRPRDRSATQHSDRHSRLVHPYGQAVAGGLREQTKRAGAATPSDAGAHSAVVVGRLRSFAPVRL